MNCASNQWEPDPWDATDEVADAQLAGFQERAAKPIHWENLSAHDWAGGFLFGHDRKWFSEKDIEFTAVHDEENLIMMRLIWHGFPDPPEWRLASRPKGQHDQLWDLWGYFADPPSSWVFPETDNALNQ